MANYGAYAKSYNKNCFAHHIKESITINQARKPVYAELTNGRSNKIFNFLISSEKFSLIPATFYDLKARAYQKKGVPVYCYEFMSMNAAPEFDPDRRIIPEETFTAFDWKHYKKLIDEASKRQSVKDVKKFSLEAIRALDSQPNYYCMLRHIFESIYRFAYFAPMHEDAALRAGLKSPMNLSFDVIKLQSLAIAGSYQIDKWAAPIQKEGIPLLCAELPKLLDDLDVTL